MESVLLIITSFLLLLGFVWYFINFILFKARVNKLLENVKPLDGELPIVGHTFIPPFRKLENCEDFYTLLREVTKDRTQDRRIWMFNMPFLLLSNIHTIEAILTNQNAVQKSHIYNLLGLDIFDGVFIAPASKWKRMRKRLNQTFNPKFYPHYINQMNYQAKIFVSKLKWLYRMNGDSYQNIQPLAVKCVLDIITSTHFGISTKQQFNAGTNYVEHIMSVIDMTLTRISRPWLHLKTIYKTTKYYRKYQDIMNTYAPFLQQMVEMSEDYQKQLDLKGRDYVVPKGTHVAIVISNVQRNPNYWEKPEEFYPEHFSAENVKSRPKYAFIPFSQGPRDCPGKVFAVYAVKCVLAEIIRNFKLEVKRSHDSTKQKLAFMIEPAEGYPVNLIPRNST